MRNKVLKFSEFSKAYLSAQNSTIVFKDMSLEVIEPQLVALMGPSGTGKTTLLNIISSVDRKFDGTVEVMGQNIGNLSSNQAANWRKSNIGYVFQDSGLLAPLTCDENVEVSLILSPIKKSDYEARKKAVFNAVGIPELRQKFPTQISRGQMQRVAIARSIVTNPKILICDEPTGNLDQETAMEIVKLLKFISEEFGTFIIMATHDNLAAQAADKIYRISNFKLIEGAF